jgi:hypothetical protein
MPWGPSYLLPSEYTVQSKWPPYCSDVHFGGNWMTRQPPFQPFEEAVPPADFNGPWWFYPKSEWPTQFQIPYEPKILGALTARKVMMWSKDFNELSNLTNYPPFGTIKVRTPSDYSGIWHGKQASFTNIKVHMRQQAWLDISPHPSLWAEGKLEEALRQMSRKRPIKLQTEYGSVTIKSMRHANWSRKLDDPRREAIEILRGSKQQEENAEALAAEIAVSKSQPKPSRDLFS